MINNLRKIREQKGMTQVEVTKLAGFKDDRYYRSNELYNRLPRIDRAIAIADALGIKDLRKIWTPEKKVNKYRKK